MELPVYELTLIAGGIGIAGTLLGVLGAYRLSLHLAERQFSHLQAISKLDAWHAAARIFVEAFASDIAALERRTETGFDIMDFLQSAHRERHANAVAVFEYFVPEAKRVSFRSDWYRHCFGEDSSGNPIRPETVGLEHSLFLYHHYNSRASGAESLAPRRIAIERMRAMVEYARDA